MTRHGRHAFIPVALILVILAVFWLILTATSSPLVAPFAGVALALMGIVSLWLAHRHDALSREPAPPPDDTQPSKATLQAAIRREQAFQEKLKELHAVSVELTNTAGVDALCRRAIELAVSRLGFDRIAILLTDEANNLMRCTFGVDPQGNIRDERHLSYPLAGDRMHSEYAHIVGQVQVWHDIDLFDSMQPVGRGWLAFSPIYDGRQTIGYIPTDNLIRQQEITDEYVELLKLFAVTVGHLITRERSKQALLESQERYRIISEMMSDYAYAYDILPDNSINTAWATQEALVRVTGYTWQEINGTFALYHPDDMERARADVERTIRGEAVSGEYRIVTKQGDIRWIQVARRVYHDPDQGRPTRFYGVAQDITERRHAEDAIIALNTQMENKATQLATLNEIARDVSLLTDLNTTLRRVLNKLSHSLPLDVFYVALYDPHTHAVDFPIMYDSGRFWEEEPITVSSSSWVSQVVFKGKPLVINRTAEELASNQKLSRMLGDTSKTSASIIIAPLSLGGENIGAISVQSYTVQAYNEQHTDLLMGAAYQIAIAIENSRLYDSLQAELQTRKQAEREIMQLNAELERRVEQRTAQLALVNHELETFAYSISHDLRAPLRTIDGFSRMLLETNADRLDEQGAHYLARIRHAAQRTGDMIDGLLTLSRVTRYELKPQAVDLGEMARSIVESLAETSPERRYRLDVQPGLTAIGDSRLLRIMLENLLSNAWKYTLHQPEPHIRVGSTHDDQRGTVVYFVQDNGAGFDPAYAGKLFDVFQRLHSDSEFPGTGVGLATVRRIVVRHGGDIWATSQVGQGATFYFTLQLTATCHDESASRP